MTYFVIGAVLGLLVIGMMKLRDQLEEARDDVDRFSSMNSELMVKNKVLVKRVIELRRARNHD